MTNPRRWLIGVLPLFLVLLLTLVWQMGCGGNSTPPAMSTTGTVTTSMTDPPTCAAPGGGFSHVFVTITRVQANISSSAAATDSGWVDLVDLRSAPKQLDLLSLVSTTCVLTTLGSTSGLPVGNYQQIRLFLLDNNPASGVATPSPNNCGSAGFNCVVQTGQSPQTLLLSSEAQTGIKIPSGQIAGGGLTVKAGQSVDFNINFDACASIVRQGNGQFRLKPALTGGEVSTNTNSISGTVVDNTSGKAVSIGGAVVLLEQPDSNNIDRVVRAGVTASDGSFIFCPLPSGNYDVVVAAKTTSAALLTTTYNATVAFKVPVGTALTTIPLMPETNSLTGSSPATITGQVTTAGTGGAVSEAVTLSALQQATPTGGPNILVTVPVFASGGQPPSMMTTATPNPATPACPMATDCFNYSLPVPASNPSVGTFSSGSINFALPAAGPVTYSVNAKAATCTVSPATVGSIAVTPGTSTAVSTVLAFTGCT